MEYKLSNYSLSNAELLRSLLVSEYGRRHWEAAKAHPSKKWGHRIIAILEFCPILGQFNSLLELIILKGCSAAKKLSCHKGRVTLVSRCDQAGANGPVNGKLASTILWKLWKKQESGVTFNSRKLPDVLRGGACSAMSLSFAKEYFRPRRVQKVDSSSSGNEVADQVRRAAAKILHCSENCRAIQAAFNSVEKNIGWEKCDFKRAKIQSLANYFGIRVLAASDSVNLNESDSEILLKKKFKELSNGVYLIRGLQLADNEKGEQHGHTSIYIKEGKRGFYYDPNLGTVQFSSKSGGYFLRRIINDHSCFKVDHYRFYALGM